MTAIFSRGDGIVSWPCSMVEEGDFAECIEVHGSHLGLGVNPAVLYAIGDRLAQDEEDWAPFDRGGLRSFFYPNSRRGEVPASMPQAR